MTQKNPSPGAASPPPLLTLRSAVILFLSLFVGILVSVLTFLAGRTLAEAVLAGLFASGASALGFNAVIGHGD